MYFQALRFNAGLKRAIFAVILSFLCIFLFASKGFNSLAFADTATDTIDGTMSIVLDTTQDPDTPIPSPDPDNPNPNPGDSGNGNNGDNSSAGGSSGGGNQDALKANSINKDGSNKDSLASTGDIFATTLVAILALATVLTTFVYISRRRLAANSGVSYSQSSNRAKSAALVLLTLTLLSGTIFTAFRAFAEGEDADALADSTAALNSKVVVDENGKIKSTDLTLKNNLKAAVTVKSISAPAEVSAWTANVDADTVVAAGDTLAKDWTPDADTIPAELLSKLKDGEEVNLTFSTEVSYTVFNITWNLNGGQGIIATSPVPENGNVVLPATNPTFDHHTFEGWNTRSDGQGDAVDENTVVTADVTFYAQWTPETYAINYQFPDGGAFAGGVEPEKTYTYGVGVDSFEEPYKQGYDFDGWYDAETSGNKVTSITTTDFGDKTLYARWTPSTYTVTYDVTGGGDTGAPSGLFVTDEDTGVKITITEIDVKSGQSMPDVTGVSEEWRIPYVLGDNMQGYVFDGWYTQPNGGGEEGIIGTTKITGNVTYYPKWVVATTFIAPKTSTVTANARTISGIKYGLNYIKTATDDLKAKERAGDITKSRFYRVFNDWMTNDSYHLYTLLYETAGDPSSVSDDMSYGRMELLDPNTSNNWAEFRIVQVGQHDSDGSGLTFQMAHGLPDTYAFSSDGKTGADLNWANSSLRAYMENDNRRISALFGLDLLNSVKSVEKKYNTTAGVKPSVSTIATTTDKLWILSYTEYQSNVNTTYWTKDQLGSTYAFWKAKNLSNDGQDASKHPELVALCKSRNGSRLSSTSSSNGNAWQRSVSPNSNNFALSIGTTGYLGSYDNGYRKADIGVNVAFAV